MLPNNQTMGEGSVLHVIYFPPVCFFILHFKNPVSPPILYYICLFMHYTLVCQIFIPAVIMYGVFTSERIWFRFTVELHLLRLFYYQHLDFAPTLTIVLWNECYKKWISAKSPENCNPFYMVDFIIFCVCFGHTYNWAVLHLALCIPF